MIKAKTVSEVMGGNQQSYIGVCDFFSKSDVDFIVGKIIEDPSIV
jgi:hypothetical protein